MNKPPIFSRATLVRMLGIVIFIGFMAAGYLYNLTFVQLGLTDLAERTLGLPGQESARLMALFAATTALLALAFGTWMSNNGRSADFRWKARVAFTAVLAQMVLTGLSLQISTKAALTVWILVAGSAMGLAVPATFGLTVDLVPVPLRGMVAGLITAMSYGAALLIPPPWHLEQFARVLLLAMPVGALVFGLLGWWRHPIIAKLSRQHLRPEFAQGRYTRHSHAGKTMVPRRLWAVIALMFGVFFIDSLGFLRIIDTPSLMAGAWGSPALNVRLNLAAAHLLGATIGAAFYSQLDDRTLFASIFGVFALTHLLYSMAVPASGQALPLAMPLLYSLVVSMYTVVTFALWADASTPQTIARNSALGVAVSGWSATFLSTALALSLKSSGLPLVRHLQLVDSMAFLLFLAAVGLLLLPSRHEEREGAAT